MRSHLTGKMRSCILAGLRIETSYSPIPSTNPMETIQGIPVSSGIAIGRAFVLDAVERYVPERKILAEDVESEIERLWLAIGGALEELKALLQRLEAHGLGVRGPGRWRVAGGKEESECKHLRQLPSALRSSGQSDVEVQRYKGLGEMDAEQLWESTMDPAVRSLYQVQLEDAVAADHIFTVLMSDGVEQRREYIERHALEATNLDI